MRASAAAVLTFLLLTSTAWADPVRTLERASSRLARTRLAEKELMALSSRGLVLSVRRGIIVASEGLRQRGFFPGSNGTLSPEDRAELSRIIARRAPGTGDRDLLRQLGRSIRAERAVEKRFDPVIDGVLRKNLGEVWRGARGSLVLKDGLLVGYRGFSSEAFWVGRSTKGLTMAPEERSRLRDFLRHAE